MAAMLLVILLGTGSGCVSTGGDTADIAVSAASQAVAEANTLLPDLPPVCVRHFDRPAPARVKTGGVVRHDTLAWEGGADTSDARVDFCARWYGQLKMDYAGKKPE